LVLDHRIDQFHWNNFSIFTKCVKRSKDLERKKEFLLDILGFILHVCLYFSKFRFRLVFSDFSLAASLSLVLDVTLNA